MYFYWLCCHLYTQEVPDGRKESAGGPWQFVGLLPLFDPPRHDSAETIRRALNLGVNVKMITGTYLAIFGSQSVNVEKVNIITSELGLNMHAFSFYLNAWIYRGC